MNQRTTIGDIARSAGVSVATVSRYLNKTGYVNDTTSQKIREAVERAEYRPNLMARGLKMQKSRIVLLVVPNLLNPFYALLARTAQQLARDAGYALVLCDSMERVSEECEAIALAQQMYAAGIMMASIYEDAGVLERMRESRLPAVTLNSFDETSPFDAVGVDRSGGTNLAVEHLLALGHVRIGFAGGAADSAIGRSRRNGYLRAMAAAGISMDGGLVVERGFSQEDGQAMGEVFLSMEELPTAICCANDLIAFGVMSALAEGGVRVPQDVSVTGMDDIPYARLSDPALTTVSNDGALFAREGFQMLLERIDGGYQGTSRFVTVPNRLLTRNTTAQPRKNAIGRKGT